jgi:glycosyltransferase involved in cell wall biosynthesis
MKIFIDGHFLDGQKHGVAIYLERLYSQYRKLQPEDELHFGLEPDSKIDYQLFLMPRVFVHRYRFGGFLRFLYDIPHLARKINADLVQTQYILPIRVGYSAKRHVTMYDVLYEDFPELFSPFYRWSRRLVFGWSVRRADLVTSISEYSRSRIAVVYGRPEKDIHLVYPGVVEDENSIVAAATVIRQNSILYVSRFEKRKNHFSLLNSFLEMYNSDSGLRMVLVGFEVDGTLSKVRDFINRHELDDVVDIRSHITDEDLENLYRTSGVVVYPSFGEGFGMPIIESLLMNPNTIFSNTTAMAEFTFASNNTFDPNDSTAITEKLKSFLYAKNINSAEWHVQCSEVRRKYNWVSSALTLVKLYHTGIHDKEFSTVRTALQ